MRTQTLKLACLLVVVCFLIPIQIEAKGIHQGQKISPSGRFIANGNQDGISILDTEKKTTHIKFGHPLGYTTPVIWVNDSTLIFETVCCEGSWWFTSTWPSGIVYRLKPKIGSEVKFGNEVHKYIYNNGDDGLQSYLDSSSFKASLKSDTLLKR